MKLCWLGIFFLCITELYAQEKVFCPYQTNQKEVEELVQTIIQKHFPNLKQANTKFRYFKNDEYFLKTFVKPLDIFKKERTYFLDINEKLYDCSPAPLALEAILVHELVHLNDFTQLGTLGFFKLLAKMATSEGRASYERQTDLRTLELGYAEGLKEYRYWIYQRLDSKALKKKKLMYYTPDEIDSWLVDYYSQGTDLDKKVITPHE
jgi:hypothetical protein